jgi:uncharacterized protein YggE
MEDMKILRIVIAALLVLALVALAGTGKPEAAGGADDQRTEGITVTGVGTIEAVPDEAEFSLGVTTKGATARLALGENSERMQRLLAALKAAGVAARDLQTQDVSVSPAYRPNEGYTASNSVSVRIRDLDRAGEILDTASRAGATNVYGPSLTRADRDGFEQNALERAVDNARKRAEALGRAAGVDVGTVTSITETTEGGYAYSDRLALGAPASEAPIEKGTEEITASVTVTFAIR